ncbi:MAG: arginase family protein [Gammaproteobacteria bacterium]|nr:arginase family protein [Gammaproteobacteria bacterium]
MSATAAPVRPFLSFELETDPARWQAPEVALLGITHSEPYAHDPWPNDQTHAPDAIRAQSAQISDGLAHWDFDVGTDLGALAPPRCLDCGNLVWQGGAYEPYLARAGALAAQLLRSGAQLVVLGGDHGVTIPVLDALQAVGTPVYLVHVDAHLDWRAEVGGVRRGYSSPLYWASQRPWVRGMTQLGMRGTGSARKGELQAARAYGSKVFTAQQLHEAGFGAALASIPADAPLYVTIDADGIDPTEAPAVMAPVPGGLRFAQLAPFLRTLAYRQRIVGLDIVEIAPALDARNAITCITAGRLIVNVLGASWARAALTREA